ncbi:hypothetical protein LZ31DRAFT_220383 [Colletotrichum somersetense]|nr:hypothetical protein LZ31DRAFT_220383 [Colletotrichum somersetense]
MGGGRDLLSQMKILKLKRAFGPRLGRRRHWLKLRACQLGKNSERNTSSSVGKVNEGQAYKQRMSFFLFFFCFFCVGDLEHEGIRADWAYAALTVF